MVGKIGTRLIAEIQAKAEAKIIEGVANRPFQVWDNELGGFGLRVQPSGVMTYFYEYRTSSGSKRRIKIARVGSVTPIQARDRAKQLSADVVKGNDPHMTKTAAQVPTMGQFLDERYESWITASRKTGDETVAMLRARFAFLLQRQLTGIDAWTVEKWRSDRVKSGIAKQTTNRGFVSLKAMLNKAVEWDVIETNPLRKIKAYRVDNNARTRFLSPDEETRLRTALIERETEIRLGRDRGNRWRTLREYEPYPSLEGKAFVDHLRPMVLIALNTGLRRGSLCNLRKEDVDFVGRKITVPAAYAKSGKTFRVPLNVEAREVLSGWLVENASNPSPLVFPSKDGLPIRELKTAWNNVLVKAGIERFRWHDLRHTFASKLVIAGVPLNSVRVLLDHSHPLMTVRYAHLSEDVTAAAVEKLCSTNPIDLIGKNTAPLQL
jgi:integrase